MKRYLILIYGLLFSAISLAQTVNVPLSFILPEGQDSTLRGQWDKLSFPLTILEDQQVNNIKVALSLTHSGNIDLAHLWVNLGDKPIANIQLQPNGISQQIVVNLSQALLERYGNIMTISVRHQLPASLSLAEQRLEASEAVTKVLAQQSYIELDFTKTTAESTLADFSALIMSGQLHDKPIQLVSQIPGNTEAALSIASQLVQGWTLRSGSKSYLYQYFDQQTQGIPDSKDELDKPSSKVQLVFGLPEQFKTMNILPSAHLAGIQGPYLGLVQQQGSNQWLLIVSGRDENELLEAAGYFANPSYPLPAYKFAVVGRYQQPGKAQLQSKGEYTISQFTPQQNFGQAPLVLPLVMPANSLFSPDEKAHINLLLAHPSVVPGEAAMVIRVNGDYANSMPLRASRWRETQHYRLSFPMNKLRPGLNKVSVELYGPEQTDSYSAAPMPFIAHIEKSSVLRLGAWVNYVTKFDQQLPADQLLFMTANNGRETQLTINYSEESQLTAIWQLLSHITWEAQRPMTELLVTENNTQRRPINLTFNVGNTLGVNPQSANENSGLLASLRHTLINSMAKMQNGQTAFSSRESTYDLEPNGSNTLYQYGTKQAYWQADSQFDQFARLTTANNGWRNIIFNADSDAIFNQEMMMYLNRQKSVAHGDIELATRSVEADKELARSGFIAYPYSLPIVLILLLLPLTLLIHRQLEKPL
ncbi:cellulose biosynthesis cyclic di-GMP-binding regulatory protein BcsB [Photobacterium sp. DNB23_23_1]